MNNRQLGSSNEEVAKVFLEAMNMSLVEKNYRTQHGEIDLIMKDKRTLVFVEVKSRRTSRAGSSLDAIDYHKRKQIIRISHHYLIYKGYNQNTNVRYDCVGIDGTDIHYIRNAFDCNGKAL